MISLSGFFCFHNFSLLSLCDCRRLKWKVSSWKAHRPCRQEKGGNGSMREMKRKEGTAVVYCGRQKRDVTGTDRVSLLSVFFSRSGVFDVGRVVPTCPAPLCQEITTASPRSPADCWEKHCVWCSKEGSPMQFSLSSLLFSFVCDSSRLWQS